MHIIPKSSKINDIDKLRDVLKKINIDTEDADYNNYDDDDDDDDDDSDDNNDNIIKTASHTTLQRCSRCGREVPENELTWTPNGDICRDCIKKQYKSMFY